MSVCVMVCSFLCHHEAGPTNARPVISLFQLRRCLWPYLDVLRGRQLAVHPSNARRIAVRKVAAEHMLGDLVLGVALHRLALVR